MKSIEAPQIDWIKSKLIISDDELETADNDEEWKDCGTNGKSCKSKISENPVIRLI